MIWTYWPKYTNIWLVQADHGDPDMNVEEEERDLVNK